MNTSVKFIIFGSALMFLGGILLITSAITQNNMPDYMVLLTYGFYIGFFIIVGTLFADSINKKR